MSVVSTRYPLNVFKISEFRPIMREYALENGLEYVEGFNINKNNGSVRHEFYAIMPEIDEVQINGNIGYGFSISDNKYGNGHFSIQSGALQLACSNGMVLPRKLGIDLRANHSSLINVRSKIWRFVKKLREKYSMQFIRYATIYEALADQLVNMIVNEQSKLRVALGKAQLTPLEKPPIELFDQYVKRAKLPQYLIEGFKEVWENDDTLEQKNNVYSYVSAITRLANAPNLTEEVRYQLQERAGKLLAKVMN